VLNQSRDQWESDISVADIKVEFFDRFQTVDSHVDFENAFARPSVTDKVTQMLKTFLSKCFTEHPPGCT